MEEAYGHLVVRSTCGSSRLENKKRKSNGSSSVCPFFDQEANHDLDRWYTMKIAAKAVDGLSSFEAK